MISAKLVIALPSPERVWVDHRMKKGVQSGKGTLPSGPRKQLFLIHMRLCSFVSSGIFRESTLNAKSGRTENRAEISSAFFTLHANPSVSQTLHGALTMQSRIPHASSQRMISFSLDRIRAEVKSAFHFSKRNSSLPEERLLFLFGGATQI